MLKKYFFLFIVFWSIFSCTDSEYVDFNSENNSITPEILYIEAMNEFDNKDLSHLIMPINEEFNMLQNIALVENDLLDR